MEFKSENFRSEKLKQRFAKITNLNFDTIFFFFFDDQQLAFKNNEIKFRNSDVKGYANLN
jgi:hypothetical protein